MDFKYQVYSADENAINIIADPSGRFSRLPVNESLFQDECVRLSVTTPTSVTHFLDVPNGGTLNSSE